MFLLFCTLQAQQNEDFKMVKGYYNSQRHLLNNEFKKKFDLESETSKKLEIKKDFQLFMMKMDSLENVALLGALIKTKNLEALNNLKKTPKTLKENNGSESKPATYPGGVNNLREKVSNLIYSDSVLADYPIIKTSVRFTVERDGSVTNVTAFGENPSFNRQAEIAMYLLPEKFSPEYHNGIAVRSRFNLPITISFK